MRFPARYRDGEVLGCLLEYPLHGQRTGEENSPLAESNHRTSSWKQKGRVEAKASILQGNSARALLLPYWTGGKNSNMTVAELTSAVSLVGHRGCGGWKEVERMLLSQLALTR